MTHLYDDLDRYLALDAPRRTPVHKAAMRAGIALRGDGPQPFMDMVRFAPLHRDGREDCLREIAGVLDAAVCDPTVRVVVEAGCGDGFWLAFLARRHPGKRFVGYDAAKNAGQYVLGRADRDGTSSRVVFHHAYHDTAPDVIGVGSADLLFSVAALLHRLPHSGGAVTPDSPEWNAFAERDPEAVWCRKAYVGFRRLLRSGGIAHVLESLCCQAAYDAHVNFASRAGLRLAQEETPVLEGDLAALRFVRALSPT